MDTSDPAYAERLVRVQGRWWKRMLPVQLPYVINLKRQRLGRTLDVGCGIGRNLQHLAPASVGVDHNVSAVQMARARGLDAYTVDEFEATAKRFEGSFDSLLIAHVLEHMGSEQAEALVGSYLPYLRRGGSVFVICPQEAGFASDTTHVWFADAAALKNLLVSHGLTDVTDYSFPLPRAFGRRFTYNEFCVRARA